MKHHDPDFLARSAASFSGGGDQSLAEIRDAAAADPNLAPNRRRDMLSAFKRLEDVGGVALDQVKASPQAVRELFDGLSRGRMGAKRKTFANTRSLVVAALKAYGRPIGRLTRRLPMSPDWKALIGRIETKFQREALHRFAVYCSVMGISPDDVVSEVLVGFRAALVAEEAIKEPRHLIKNTIANWNRSMRTIPSWPQVALRSPFKVAPFMLPLDALPASFQEEVAAWTNRMLHPDLMDDYAPVKPLREVTISHRILGFRLFASALVSSGRLSPEEIVSIATLVEPENFKAAIEAIHRRRGKTQSLHNLARAMRLIAQHHCRLGAEDLERLERLCRRLHVEGRGRMTDRNRERLGQFDDPETVRRFLAIPSQEWALAQQQGNPLRAAKAAERGLIMALLIHAGLRLQTLRTLRIEYFRWTSHGECHLLVPAQAMKANRPHEVVLAREAAELLRSHLDMFRSRLPGAEGPYLFPGSDGGPRSKNAAYEAVKTALERAGVAGNPHLVRHVIAKICLELDPASAFAVSRMLGHASLATTSAHYLGTESKAAGRFVDKLLDKAREGARDAETSR